MQMHASPYIQTLARRRRQRIFSLSAVHAFRNSLGKNKTVVKKGTKNTTRNQEKIEIDMVRSVKYSGNMHRPI